MPNTHIHLLLSDIHSKRGHCPLVHSVVTSHIDAFKVQTLTKCALSVLSL